MSGVWAVKGATCPRFRCRVDVLVEKLRREKHFIDKPPHRFPIVAGDSQFALTRCAHDVLDATGEFEVRCVRPVAGLLGQPQRGLLISQLVGADRLGDPFQEYGYRGGVRLQVTCIDDRDA